MRNAILALLAKGPAHGYELKHDIEDLFGDVWPPTNIGQIYTTLGRLERDGLVQSVHVAQAHRPDKRVYELTYSGRGALDTWLGSPTVGPRIKDEFFTKVILAGQPGINGGNDPGALIERQRRTFLQALRDLDVLAGQAGQQDDAANPAALLLIEGAILHLQADLKWLELCEARLTRGD